MVALVVTGFLLFSAEYINLLLQSGEDRAKAWTSVQDQAYVMLVQPWVLTMLVALTFSVFRVFFFHEFIILRELVDTGRLSQSCADAYWQKTWFRGIWRRIFSWRKLRRG